MGATGSRLDQRACGSGLTAGDPVARAAPGLVRHLRAVDYFQNLRRIFLKSLGSWETPYEV